MTDRLSFRACDRCGAIVSVVSSSQGSIIDNEAEHYGWHDQLNDLLALLTRHAQTSARARLRRLFRRSVMR